MSVIVPTAENGIDELYARLSNGFADAAETTVTKSAEVVKFTDWSKLWIVWDILLAILRYSWRLVVLSCRPAFAILRWLLGSILTVLRPATLILQLCYHVVIGIPLDLARSLSQTLYPAYLYLTTAAFIGIVVGVGLALSSQIFSAVCPPASTSDALACMKDDVDDDGYDLGPASLKGRRRLTHRQPHERPLAAIEPRAHAFPAQNTRSFVNKGKAKSVFGGSRVPSRSNSLQNTTINEEWGDEYTDEDY
ncbi:hypothetical protein PYCC9005_000178 [Savitreella phatthalungensis]